MFICLPGYPEKGLDTEIRVADGHPEDKSLWDVDVISVEAFGMMRVRRPEESRTVCTVEMLALCMEAAPGEADLFIRNLLCEEDAEYVIKHYYTSKSFAHPEAFRA